MQYRILLCVSGHASGHSVFSKMVKIIFDILIFCLELYARFPIYVDNYNYIYMTIIDFACLPIT